MHCDPQYMTSEIHSFSVTYKNIAIDDISLKTIFGLHFCRSRHRFVFNHFDVIGRQS